METTAIPQDDFLLTRAIMLYERNGGGSSQGDVGPRTYVEVHAVAHGEQGPELLEGRPLGFAEADSLAKSISAMASSGRCGLLPERVLSLKGNGDLAWWCPAGKRPLVTVETLGVPQGEAHHPALLFCLTQGSNLSVYALDVADKRPDEGSKLYIAPYWNVYSNGSICMGTANVSGGGTVAKRIKAAEAVFFGSAFSHHIGAGNLVNTKDGGLEKLWKGLVGTDKPFPTKVLVLYTGQQTVGSYLTSQGF